ncbi:MAG: hypothetical protein JNK81_03420, partial [Anaerolineales bacterium]|nr:hypothetical protein [Anaerolineales bacterium]
SRVEFIQKLLELAQETSNKTTVVIALRADFYSHCSQYPLLRNAVAAQQEYIGQMNANELRRAIEEPAKHGGWEFEKGLVDVLLNDVGATGSGEPEPGALPLLSHALLATWEHRRGKMFTIEGYRASGSVQGAIAETAESVFTDQLNVQQQQIARDVFLRLTELGEGTEDTRRRAALNELVRQSTEATQLRTVLNTLAEARLITLNEDSAEVAHEALIREWQRLHEWLTQGREGLRLHRHLTESTREWELRNKDVSELYRGARLAQANEWAVENQEHLNELEREFLQASLQQEQHEALEKEAQRERELEVAKKLAENEKKSATTLRLRNRIISVIGVLAILLAIVAGIFGKQSSESYANAESQRLAAEANGILQRNESAELAALLSIRGLQTQYSPQADAALQRASHKYYGEQLYVLPSRVDFVSFSPDGKYIIAGSGDFAGHVFDLESQKEVMQLKDHKDTVIQAFFSPDEKHILTSSYDETVHLWDAKTRKELKVLPFFGKFIQFSPDGKTFLASNGVDIAQLWDIENDKEIQNWNAQRALFSKDGKWVITIYQGTLNIWDVNTNELIKEFPINDSPENLWGMDITADNRYLATAWQDSKTITIWDLTTGEAVQTFEGHNEFIFQIAFSPDGKYLLSGSLDTTARLWDVATGQEIRRYNAHTAAVYSVAFSPDGHHIATSGKDGSIRIWDITIPNEINTLTAQSNFLFGLKYSRDGKYFITGSADGTAALWDTSTNQLLHLLNDGRRVDGVDITPDNKLIVTSGQGSPTKLWDLQTGELIHTFDNSPDGSGAAVFTPDGKYIVTTAPDPANFAVYDVQTYQLVRIIEIPPNTPDIAGFTLSQDGKYIAIPLDTEIEVEGHVLWIDFETGKQIGAFQKNSDAVWAAISADNRYLLTGSRDNIARIWDIQTGELLQELVGHTNIIWRVAFSPDGKYALTASQDKTARLWGVQTGEQIRLFPGYGNFSVANATFSPDGKNIVIGSFNGYGQITPVDLQELIDTTCSRLLRDLTDSERMVYGIENKEAICQQNK